MRSEKSQQVNPDMALLNNLLHPMLWWPATQKANNLKTLKSKLNPY
jgi:hypothetical protein